jgi:hypothetical protein
MPNITKFICRGQYQIKCKPMGVSENKISMNTKNYTVNTCFFADDQKT